VHCVFPQSFNLLDVAPPEIPVVTLSLRHRTEHVSIVFGWVFCVILIDMFNTYLCVIGVFFRKMWVVLWGMKMKWLLF
jgi:hypothetical protein